MARAAWRCRWRAAPEWPVRGVVARSRVSRRWQSSGGCVTAEPTADRGRSARGRERAGELAFTWLYKFSGRAGVSVGLYCTSRGRQCHEISVVSLTFILHFDGIRGQLYRFTALQVTRPRARVTRQATRDQLRRSHRNRHPRELVETVHELNARLPIALCAGAMALS